MGFKCDLGLSGSREAEGLDHSLDGDHANLTPKQMSLELALEERSSADLQAHLPSPGLQGLSCLSAAISALVLVRRCAGRPCRLCRRTYTSNFRLLFPVQLTTLPPPPPPYRLQLLKGVLLLRLSSAAAIFPADITAGPSRSGTVSCLDCHRGARLDPRWPGQGWRRGRP